MLSLLKAEEEKRGKERNVLAAFVALSDLENVASWALNKFGRPNSNI